jgi:hypothetical protein
MHLDFRSARQSIVTKQNRFSRRYGRAWACDGAQTFDAAEKAAPGGKPGLYRKAARFPIFLEKRKKKKEK